MQKSATCIFFLLIISFSSISQDLTQVVRGSVRDKNTHEPIIGANVVIVDSEPFTGSVTDDYGVFRLEKVPVGRQTLRVTYLGYEPVIYRDLEINANKEVVLNITLEETIIEGKVIEVIGKKDKKEAANKMATVSARTFSIEESRKYAGSLNDVSRMAQNFAGVQSSNDTRNDLIIRGNSSMGVLYRLDGIDIPNPNHFALSGTSGGPISILNNNTLSNSDFFTGAFPAEYGNAIAGIFDLNIREGNNETHEFLGQIGFNGAEFMAEGPVSRKLKSSYLLSYRYSTLEFFKLLGVSFGTLAVPSYQDITFKLNFPNKKGYTSIFGIGGDSKISFLDSERGEDDNFWDQKGSDLVYGTRMGASGISNSLLLKNGYLKSGLGINYNKLYISNDTLNSQGKEPFNVYLNDNADGKVNFYSYLNQKINRKNIIRAGVYADLLFFNLSERVFLNKNEGYFYRSDDNGHTFLIQPFAEWKLHINKDLSLVSGIHYQHLTLNGNSSIEPRIGIRWELDPANSLSAGYGRHSLSIPLRVHFRKLRLPGGATAQPNMELGFIYSQHFVAGYDHYFNENLRIKTEIYYQHIDNVPVDASPSSYSMLNTGANFYFSYPDSLINNGKGENYGVELTFEKFLFNNYYFLITGSLFKSKYLASDGHWYNTAFNGNFAFNALAGKEFLLTKKNKERTSQTLLSLNGRITWNGGQRYTPILLEESQRSGHAVYDQSRIFEPQFPDYLRTDLRVALKRDGKKVTQELAVELQNITGRKNLLNKEYDADSGEVESRYQIGFLPVAQYRIYF